MDAQTETGAQLLPHTSVPKASFQIYSCPVDLAECAPKLTAQQSGEYYTVDHTSQLALPQIYYPQIALQPYAAPEPEGHAASVQTT